MRDVAAAHYNPAAPQSPAKTTTVPLYTHIFPQNSGAPRYRARRESASSTASSASLRLRGNSLSPDLETYNSHRRPARSAKIGDRKVYRPVRRNTLSRIEEAEPMVTLNRNRSKSLQQSADFYSTRRITRSRSNISADTSRSVPVCNQSQDLYDEAETHSPQYADPIQSDDSSAYGEPVSVREMPVMLPMQPALTSYVTYAEARQHYARLDRYRWKYNMKMQSSARAGRPTNLYLAFMY